MPSPTYQWTKARLAYIRSNLWSMREQISAMHVASGHDRRRLVGDAALESGRAPVDKLDGALGLDGGHRGDDILGHHVAAVHEAARHVLAVARVYLDKHRGRVKRGAGDFGDRQLLVIRLLGRDERSVGRNGQVYAGVRHKVGLELGQVQVKCAVEPERRSERRGDLGNEPVQIGVGRPLQVQAAPRDVVERLVVHHKLR
eukprot:scaffold21439_cov129-Isochrysis_galbana.AAC.3